MSNFQTKFYTYALPLLALTGLFAVAFFVNSWVSDLVTRAGNSFGLGNTVVLVFSFSSLLTVASCFLFCGVMFSKRADSNLLVAVLCILIGLFILFYNPIALFFPQLSLGFTFSLLPLAPPMAPLIAGATVLIVGAINIVRWWRVQQAID